MKMKYRSKIGICVSFAFGLLSATPLFAQPQRHATDYFLPQGGYNRFLPQAQRNVPQLPDAYSGELGGPTILIAPVPQTQPAPQVSGADAFYSRYAGGINRPAPRATTSLSSPPIISQPHNRLAEITNMHGAQSAPTASETPSNHPLEGSQAPPQQDAFRSTPRGNPDPQWFRAPPRRAGAAAPGRTASAPQTGAAAGPSSLNSSRPLQGGAFDPRRISQAIDHSRLTRSASPVFMYDDPQRLEAQRAAEQQRAMQAFERSLEDSILLETKIVMLSPVEVKHQNGTATVRGIVADEASRVLATQTLLKFPQIKNVDNQMTVYQP